MGDGRTCFVIGIVEDLLAGWLLPMLGTCKNRRRSICALSAGV
jgi:hypothetical protein